MLYKDKKRALRLYNNHLKYLKRLEHHTNYGATNTYCDDEWFNEWDEKLARRKIKPWRCDCSYCVPDVPVYKQKAPKIKDDWGEEIDLRAVNNPNIK